MRVLFIGDQLEFIVDQKIGMDTTVASWLAGASNEIDGGGTLTTSQLT